MAIEKIVSADGFVTLQSGFLGLTGDSDLRSVIAAADSGNAQAKLAIEVLWLAAHMCQPHRCVQEAHCNHCSVNFLQKRATCASCAPQVFIHRLRKYVGTYLIELEGSTDAICFSAGPTLEFLQH